MKFPTLHTAETPPLPSNRVENSSSGFLLVAVVSSQNNFPIQNATVSIAPEGAPSNIIEELTTNSSGQTEDVSLPAPPEEYSLEPSEIRPYSEYYLHISAPGFKPVDISGTEILSGATAIQNVRLEPLDDTTPTENNILIPEHTLYKEYPPKIAEPEIKPIANTGEIVLSRIVVPQTVVVHDGVPSNTSAPNYYVPYRDYIKNVASSEIYATWPQATIVANVLAIMSFTLNRVYTEWYRGQGYDFTITSSTAFDHKWIYGRNIYESISAVVDDIFDSFLSRPGVRQPILTQYCDGRMVQCPNWMAFSQENIKFCFFNFLCIFHLLFFLFNDIILGLAKRTAYWSSGQDVALSRRKPGFDSRIGHKAAAEFLRQLFCITGRNNTAKPAAPVRIHLGELLLLIIYRFFWGINVYPRLSATSFKIIFPRLIFSSSAISEKSISVPFSSIIFLQVISSTFTTSLHNMKLTLFFLPFSFISS